MGKIPGLLMELLLPKRPRAQLVVLDQHRDHLCWAIFPFFLYFVFAFFFFFNNLKKFASDQMVR